MDNKSDIANMRFEIANMISELRGPDGKGASREISLAITKLQEAGFWLEADQYKYTTEAEVNE